MSLVTAFSDAVAPIVAVIGLGVLLGRRFELAVDPLNAVALYAFFPALVFHSLSTAALGGSAATKVVVGVAVFVAAMMAVAGLVGRATGVDRSLRGALLLASAFPNAGFVGVPLAAFAFGAVGRTTAVLFMTAQAVLMYTVGAYVASRGGGRAVAGAVRAVLRLPLVYAVIAAGLVRWLGAVPSTDGTVMTTIGLVGDAAIPLVLVIVGIQLSGLALGDATRVVTPAGLKLVVAPVVGIGVAVAMAFDDPTVARVFVLECAGPVAVVPLALVIEYGDGDRDDALSAADYLTTAVFVTTLASVVVLTILIAALRAGVLV